MTKDNLSEKILDVKNSLLDLARKMCWNKISDNCLFIVTKIENDYKTNFTKRQKIEYRLNNKKTPRPLDQVIDELLELYNDFYEINLQIFRSLKDKTIIDIRYFPKSAFDKNYFDKIKYNEPLIDCKIPIPQYVSNTNEKFDINWVSGGLIVGFKMFLWKIKIKNIG